MARYGVTYQAVCQAAQQLAQQGRQPTVEQVRLILGTGSSTTIANHLRQWHSHQKLTPELAGKEHIPNELLSVVKELWEKTLINVHQTVASMGKFSQPEYDDLKKECEKYKLNNQRWQKLFEQWQNEKKRLDHEVENLKQQNEKLLLENSRLNRRESSAELITRE